MKVYLLKKIIWWFVFMVGAQSASAFTCETTRVTSETVQGMSNSFYLADCRIMTEEASPFILEPGQKANFTAEQEIRLAPGFHAHRGSRFHAKLRDCIRNPDPNTGYASWGNYDRYSSVHDSHPNEQWMKLTAESFVRNLNRHGLSVEMKYEDELAEYGVHIPDFYCDAQRIAANVASGARVPDECSGKDDDLLGALLMERRGPNGELIRRYSWHHGIDHGVFFFHIGHGGGNTLGPYVRDGDETGTTTTTNADCVDVERSNGHSSKIRWTNFGLGNCSSDGSNTGELRYFWLCSCRSFGHGPRIESYSRKDPTTRNRDEYDRPSLFDATATGPAHANVFARLGPVLGDNMRMACGASTSASCAPELGDRLRAAYFDDGLSVAESWGKAHTQVIPRRGRRGNHPLTDSSGNPILDSNGNQLTRIIYVTPLCIARGNNDIHDLRSPITDDLRFSEKPNPYDEALHVVYWETHDSMVEQGSGTDIPLSQQIGQLPVLLVEGTIPTWSLDGKQMIANGKFLAEVQTSDKYFVKQDSLISKETTNDGRPKVKVDITKGTVALAGNRARLSADKNSKVLSIKEYEQIAKRFIREQGWSESDMGQMVAIKAGLQVMPISSRPSKQSDAPKLINTQKDITFSTRRQIQVDKISVKTFGSDNQIIVQMNNDGSIIRASKRWSKITQKVDGIPVKSFKVAYEEATQQLGNRFLYEMTDWDWGYQSIIDKNGQQMMIVYYTFNFEPISMVSGCIDSPITIQVPGHKLGDESVESMVRSTQKD